MRHPDDNPMKLQGLAKYTDLFLRHEIDLETFAQLSEPDLKEIGVQTFGARKKLACLANSLSKSVPGDKMSCSIGFAYCFFGDSSVLPRQHGSRLQSWYTSGTIKCSQNQAQNLLYSSYCLLVIYRVWLMRGMTLFLCFRAENWRPRLVRPSSNHASAR